MNAPAGRRHGSIGLVVRGAAARGVATVVLRGAAFATTILLARWLAADGAGSFFLAVAGASVLASVVAMGLPETLARSIPALEAAGRAEEANGIVSASLRAVAAATGIVVVPVATIEIAVGSAAVVWALSVSVLAGVFALEAVGSSALRARGRILLAEGLQSIGPLLFLVVLVVVAHRAAPSAAPAFVLRVGFELAAAGLMAALIGNLGRRSLVATRVRQLARTSLPFWIVGLAWLAIQHVDILILGLSKGSAVVGWYVPVLRTADLSVVALGLFGAYVLPAVAALNAGGRAEEAEAVYLHASACAFALSAPVIAALVVAPRVVVGFLLGGAPDGVGVVARLLACAYAVNSLLGLNGAVIQALGDVRALARRSAVVLAGTVCANAILVPPFGATGAALGTFVGLTALNVANSAALYRRHGITPFRMPVLVPAGATTVVMTTWWGVGPTDDIVSVAALAGTVAFAAAGSAWWSLRRRVGGPLPSTLRAPA